MLGEYAYSGGSEHGSTCEEHLKMCLYIFSGLYAGAATLNQNGKLVLKYAFTGAQSCSIGSNLLNWYVALLTRRGFPNFHCKSLSRISSATRIIALCTHLITTASQSCLDKYWSNVLKKLIDIPSRPSILRFNSRTWRLTLWQNRIRLPSGIDSGVKSFWKSLATSSASPSISPNPINWTCTAIAAAINFCKWNYFQSSKAGWKESMGNVKTHNFHCFLEQNVGEAHLIVIVASKCSHLSQHWVCRSEMTSRTRTNVISAFESLTYPMMAWSLEVLNSSKIDN